MFFFSPHNKGLMSRKIKAVGGYGEKVEDVHIYADILRQRALLSRTPPRSSRSTGSGNDMPTKWTIPWYADEIPRSTL